MSRRRHKGLSRRTRFFVLQRDLFTCQYCGRTAPAVPLDVDHIVPVASGGEDDVFNLVAACQLMARHFGISFDRDAPAAWVERLFDSDVTLADLKDAARRSSDWAGFERDANDTLYDIACGRHRPRAATALDGRRLA